MKAPRPTRLSPHRAPIDEALLAGHTALGEPLALLVSALFRLQFGAPAGATIAVSATWTNEEGDAMVRAMERVETPVPGDTRTVGRRDSDRFIAVAHHVLRQVDELQRTQGSAV